MARRTLLGLDPIFLGFEVTDALTLGSIPLDEWPARRRDLYTQRSQERDIHAPSGILTPIPADDRPKTNALDECPLDESTTCYGVQVGNATLQFYGSTSQYISNPKHSSQRRGVYSCNL